MPAAHTTSSAGISLPFAVFTPRAETSVTFSPVSTSTLSFFSRPSTATDKRSGSAGRIFGRGFDDGDLDVAFGIDAIKAEGDEFADGVVQFRGQFHARGAGADDGDVQLPGVQWFGLRVGAQAGVEQPRMEKRGLLRIVQRDRVLRGTGGAEIVGGAAYCHHQRVVSNGAG